MGMDADAWIAWGIDLSDEYGDTPEEIKEAVNDLDGNREVWPAGIAYDFTGSLYNDVNNYALVISRTGTRSCYACEPVDPESITPPTPEEVLALDKLCDAIGFKGDRTPRLLLGALLG